MTGGAYTERANKSFTCFANLMNLKSSFSIPTLSLLGGLVIIISVDIFSHIKLDNKINNIEANLNYKIDNRVDDCIKITGNVASGARIECGRR